MTHLLFLLSVLNAALVPLAAWGEEATPLSSPSGKNRPGLFAAHGAGPAASPSVRRTYLCDR